MQHSKHTWLQSGDHNSRYFHAYATSRKRNNTIHRLQNSDGAWVNWEIGLVNVVNDYLFLFLLPLILISMMYLIVCLQPLLRPIILSCYGLLLVMRFTELYSKCI